jgi:hypothetical protein
VLQRPSATIPDLDALNIAEAKAKKNSEQSKLQAQHCKFKKITAIL